MCMHILGPSCNAPVQIQCGYLHVNHTLRHLPVDYQANKNAWKTGEIWSEWLKKVDSRMRRQKRQIVMLCDNCAAHTSDVCMTNVKLVFLPPNTTSLIQPMDQGIIANFKRHYRSLVGRHLMTTIDENSNVSAPVTELCKKLTVLVSLHMQKEAWSRITVQTIVNCYRRASFIKETDESEMGFSEAADAADSETDLPSGVSSDVFARYVDIDTDLPVSVNNTDAEICAEIQAAADSGESDDEDDGAATGDINKDINPATFSDAVQSLPTLRAYLETSGCMNYGPYYAIADQVYGLNRKNSIQRSVTDYFSRI